MAAEIDEDLQKALDEAKDSDRLNIFFYFATSGGVNTGNYRVSAIKDLCIQSFVGRIGLLEGERIAEVNKKIEEVIRTHEQH